MRLYQRQESKKKANQVLAAGWKYCANNFCKEANLWKQMKAQFMMTLRLSSISQRKSSAA
jgi:hypothetical protein